MRYLQHGDVGDRREEACSYAAGPLRSHRCTWDDLLVPFAVKAGHEGLDLGDGWADRWTATWRYAKDEVTNSVRHLAHAPVVGRGPMRGFTWRRDQRHRPGLQPVASAVAPEAWD